MLTLLLIVICGCTKNREQKNNQEVINSTEYSSEAEGEGIDEAIDLVIADKYNEALVLLEKINIKKPNNKNIEELINQINSFIYAQNSIKEDNIDEAIDNFQKIVDDKKGLNTLKNKAQKEIETLKNKAQKETNNETYDNYAKQRNTLKEYAENPSVIDSIPDSQFQKIIDDRLSQGIMELYTEELLTIFSNIVPDAKLNLEQFSATNTTSDTIDELTAKNLAIEYFKNTNDTDLEYNFIATDKGDFFMIFGHTLDDSLRSTGTDRIYNVYKNTGEIIRVDRFGSPL